MSDNNGVDANEKNVKIFVRILSSERCCEPYAKIDTERKKIYIRCLQEMQLNRIAISKEPSYWCFQLDDVFHDASQEEVYRVSSEDLVPKILDGVSCVLMGYGQTGSGKSFTISGLRNNWEHRGLVARLISQMFAEKAHRKRSNKIEYSISYVELHGKEAKDLLTCEAENRVRISDREPFKNISMVIVDNEEEALRKIFEGEVRRSSTKGSTYHVSHLATSVITFHVSNVSLITSWETVTTAKMHIVEAAGTGTVSANNCWKAATDIGMANVMKIQLEQFFSYLTEARTSANSWTRSSNLLKILGSAFSVTSIIRFISHIRITAEDLGITLSTLRLTLKIARLKPVRVREDVRYSSELLLHKLQDEVNSLKKELMLNNLFLNQEALINISKTRMEQINRSVLNFLNGKISDFTLFNVSQAQMLLKSIKDLYNRLTAKELEVEKLKETYEDLTKTLTQASTLSKEAVSPVEGRRSTLSDIPEVESNKEVGNLQLDGNMTLGPYTGKEENVKKYPSPIEHHQKIHLPEVRFVFERFLREKKEYARIKENLDKIEKTLSAVRQRFSHSIENYFQAKRNLEYVRDKLSKRQQLRYVMEPEICSKETEVPEIEKMIYRDVLCHQKVLVNLEEEVRQEEDEINKLFEQHVELCSKLESGFRDYCKTINLLLGNNDRPIKILLEPSDNESLEIMRRKFNKFQRAMFRKIEVHLNT